MLSSTFEELSFKDSTPDYYDCDLKSYQIICPLGRGACGYVYKIKKFKTSEQLALKVIDKHEKNFKNIEQRLKKEIKIQSELDHINIIRLLKHFEDEQNCYLLMELGVNGELHQHLKEHKRLSEEAIVDIGFQLASGLKYLHDKDIVHRDLKLQNILMSGGTVKIADFGLSTKISDDDPECHTLCGTPNYISPEIVNEQSYGKKTDIWSFGCILYALCTGQPPFMSESAIQTIQNVKRGHLTLPEGISPLLRDLLLSTINWNSSLRFTIEQVLAHRFFQEKNSFHTRIFSDNVLASVNSNLPTTGSVAPLKESNEHNSNSSLASPMKPDRHPEEWQSPCFNIISSKQSAFQQQQQPFNHQLQIIPKQLPLSISKQSSKTKNENNSMINHQKKWITHENNNIDDTDKENQPQYSQTNNKLSSSMIPIKKQQLSQQQQLQSQRISTEQSQLKRTLTEQSAAQVCGLKASIMKSALNSSQINQQQQSGYNYRPSTKALNVSLSNHSHTNQSQQQQFQGINNSHNNNSDQLRKSISGVINNNSEKQRQQPEQQLHEQQIYQQNPVRQQRSNSTLSNHSMKRMSQNKSSQQLPSNGTAITRSQIYSYQNNNYNAPTIKQSESLLNQYKDLCTKSSAAASTASHELKHSFYSQPNQKQQMNQKPIVQQQIQRSNNKNSLGDTKYNERITRSLNRLQYCFDSSPNSLPVDTDRVPEMSQLKNATTTTRTSSISPNPLLREHLQTMPQITSRSTYSPQNNTITTQQGLLKQSSQVSLISGQSTSQQKSPLHKNDRLSISAFSNSNTNNAANNRKSLMNIQKSRSTTIPSSSPYDEFNDIPDVSSARMSMNTSRSLLTSYTASQFSKQTQNNQQYQQQQYICIDEHLQAGSKTSRTESVSPSNSRAIKSISSKSLSQSVNSASSVQQFQLAQQQFRHLAQQQQQPQQNTGINDELQIEFKGKNTMNKRSQSQQQLKQHNNHSLQNIHLINPSCTIVQSPLSTHGLAANKLSTKNGLIEVRADHWLSIQCIKTSLVFTISPDGKQIEIQKIYKGVKSEKSYTLETLPSKYDKIYSYAKVVCATLKTKVPQVKIVNDDGIFMLMATKPSQTFNAELTKSGIAIEHVIGTHVMQVTTAIKSTDNRVYQIDLCQSKLASSTYPEDVTSAIKLSLHYMTQCLAQLNQKYLDNFTR